MSTQVVIVDGNRVECDNLEDVVNVAIKNRAKFIRLASGTILYDYRNNRHLLQTDEHCEFIRMCSSGLVPLEIYFFKVDGSFRVLHGRYHGGDDGVYFSINLPDGGYRRVDKSTIVYAGVCKF